MLHDHIQTLGRTPPDGWSARHTGLYLTTHNEQKRETSMFPAGFEPVIPASQRPQTRVSECATTGIGVVKFPNSNFVLLFSFVLKNGVQAKKVDFFSLFELGIRKYCVYTLSMG
jgi:hypothetical protein